MIFSFFLCLLAPTACLPASSSQDIAPRPSRIPLLQQMCADTIRKSLLYEASPEIAARQFAELKNNINVYTVPIILSALNETLINRIGWQAPCALSEDTKIEKIHAYNADNLYDETGSRIEYITRTTGGTADILTHSHRMLHSFHDIPLGQNIRGFTYSADHAYIALQLMDRIQIRQKSDGTLVKQFYSEQPALQVEFSKDGRTLIYAMYGTFTLNVIRSVIRFFDIATGECRRTIENAHKFCLSPDGKLRACCSPDGELYIYDEETGACLQKFPMMRTFAFYAPFEWSPDGTHFMWAWNNSQKDITIILWNRNTRRCCTVTISQDHFQNCYRHFLKTSAFTQEGDLLIEVEVYPKQNAPHLFLCRSYLAQLQALADYAESGETGCQLISFLLTALEQSWRYHKAHPVSEQDRERFFLLTKVCSFMQNKKLFELD